MPALFLSHASRDDANAGALEAWLKANGFTDLFVDHTDIAGGQKWEDALKASAWACRVVVCLVTENWLASSECFGEFKAAWYMGKRIVPLFRLARPGELLGDAKQRFDKVCAEFQGLDLARCIGPSGTLDIDADAKVAERLRIGLRAAGAIAKVGLDPQAFAIDTMLRATPFPGLSSFGDEDADAALFYGRGLEIARTLEELRQPSGSAVALHIIKGDLVGDALVAQLRECMQVAVRPFRNLVRLGRLRGG